MINVTIRTNVAPFRSTFTPDTTLRAIFDAAGVDSSSGSFHIDGAPMEVGAINKTLAELGYDGSPNKASCFITQIKKLDNAAC